MTSPKLETLATDLVAAIKSGDDDAGADAMGAWFVEFSRMLDRQERRAQDQEKRLRAMQQEQSRFAGSTSPKHAS